MCGIVGYIGRETATPILISGLKRLEYRGYDSAGITVQENGSLATRKAPGKISELEKLIVKEGQPKGQVGIAHTRWATHGPPNHKNAHPHVDCSGTISPRTGRSRVVKFGSPPSVPATTSLAGAATKPLPCV